MEIIIILLILGFIGFKIYEIWYYRTDEFKKLKESLKMYVINSNDLNEHIESLKNTFSSVEQINYGTAEIKNQSRHNYKGMKNLNTKKSEFIYDCSSSVLKNAQNQPFKYLCKYFNIKTSEESLQKFENLLNNFSAAEEGKSLLVNELKRIKVSISKDIPIIIRTLSMKKFMKKVGFQTVDLSTVYFPVYTFRYVSSGGNKSASCNITLDVDNLNNFVEYLSNIVKFRKSAAGQRALMTSKLRQFIKERDSFTCQKCSLSIRDERNLLLEIDHIIPIAKGGLSEESNLQTLCWRCNRTKGSKIE